MIHAADRGVPRGRGGVAAMWPRCGRQGRRNAMCICPGRGMSPEMALRLEAWPGEENGGNADPWLAQQSACDLWQARERRAESGESAGARVTARPRVRLSRGSARRAAAS
ncbi:LacI family transcriptional regulator [Burkholderia latens]